MKTKIMPVTDLRKNTSEVIRQIRETNEVVYVTQHGRPAVVLIDYEQYEALYDEYENTHDEYEEMIARWSTPVKPQLQPLNAEQRQDLIDLIQSWIDEGDPEEHKETGEALIKGLDENRLSYRKLFPAEMKGITW